MEQDMPRINVYVPDAMKERMDALGDRVNWSEAAQAAFGREIVNATFKGDNMEGVIERLRASKSENEKAELDRGRKAGHEWACKYASYADLKAVSDMDPESQEKNLASKVDDALGRNLHKGDMSFWMDEETGRVKYPSDRYVYGFWDAADDVFIQVEDKL
jgi:hypothetical protein